MKNIKNFKQYENIYSANWEEEYDPIRCDELDLESGDEFEFNVGKAHYSYDEKPTKRAYYLGKKYDLIYFEYDRDSIVYKIPIKELEEKFIKKL